MAPHKSAYAVPTRLGPQPDMLMASTRLPVRNGPAAIPSQRAVPINTSPSKLTKRNLTAGRDTEQAHTTVRSIQKAAVSRLAAAEPPKRQTPSPSEGNPWRYASQDAQYTRNQQPNSRGPRFIPTRTPSLVSGSSASTGDSPRSNALRRRQVIETRNHRSSPSESMCSQDSNDALASSGYKDPYPDAVLGISMPPSAPIYSTDPHTLVHMDRYIDTSALAHENLYPPVPYYAASSTPSTTYSSGPFSVTSTPTSVSSHSTSVAQQVVSKAPQKLQQASANWDTRPPLTRTRISEKSAGSDSDRLASVRESSSSSASTIRPMEFSSRHAQKAKLSVQPPLSSRQARGGASVTSMDPRSRAGSDARSPETKTPVQPFPEFAHLNTASPRKNSFSSIPPARPSRDGTPEINFQQQVSPIIQSNMTSLPMSTHRRQLSSDSKRSDTIPRFAPKRSLSRNPSPSPSQTSIRSPKSSYPPTRGITPEVQSDGERAQKVKATPPMTSKPFSRFGFFSKKSKPEQGPNVLTKDRPARKGPAAGTGHEGYGKFATRGRSGSTTSGTGSTSAGRSPSADSATPSVGYSSRKSSIGSQASSDMDDFFADRLAPITIRGSAPNNSELDRKQSEDGSVRGLGLTNTTSNSSTASLNAVPKRPVLLPSPMSDSVLSKEPVKRPFASRTDKKNEPAKAGRIGLSTTTSKRSSLMSFKGEKTSTALPKSRDNVVASARKASEPSGLSRSTPRASQEEEMPRQPRNAETVPKVSGSTTKPTKKWNFFQRSKSPARKTKEPESLPATVPRQLPVRSVAHYAIMDPQKTIDLEELERIMSEAEKEDVDEPEPVYVHVERAAEKPVNNSKRPLHGNSILLPEPPAFVPAFADPPRPASPKVTLQPQRAINIPEDVARQYSRMAEQQGYQSAPVIQQPFSPFTLPTAAATYPPAAQQMMPAEGQPRPSRLPQVGRIPKVISHRDRQREHEKHPSESSFSRPFAPTHPSPAVRTSIGNVLQLLSAADMGMQNAPGFPFQLSGPQYLTSSPLLYSDEDQQLSPDQMDPRSIHPGLEFLRFQPRKNSELSVGSSNSGMMQYISPTTNGSMFGPRSGEDEVWVEYDDLLEALSPLSPLSPLTPRTPKTPRAVASPGSSPGAPFHYASGLAKLERKTSWQLRTANGSPLMIQGENEPPVPPIPVIPSVAAIVRKVRIPSATDSRILSIIPALATPTSPVSLSDFVNAYGERNLSVIDPTSGRLSLPSSGRFSGSRHSLPASARSSSGPTTVNGPLPQLPGNDASQVYASKSRRDSRYIEAAEKEHLGFENMANLRFGALMTSKWLSFGRVLFSPVHNDLKDPAEDRILILDGLGKGMRASSIFNQAPLT